MAKDTRAGLGDRSAQNGSDPDSADIDFIGPLTLLAVAAFIFLSFELADPRLWAALLCLVLFGGVLYYRSLFDLLTNCRRTLNSLFATS